MNILEFIRRNSLLVLIVIVGVGLGLVMMDYSGKASAFSRDFYIRVDNTNYSYQETAALGENGSQFLSALFSATRDSIGSPDANEDGTISADEEAAFMARQQEHPEAVEAINKLNSIYADWHYGEAKDAPVNVAINRAILKAESERLGIYPEEGQVTAYLRAMPAFRKSDGSFDTELYRRLTGFRRGNTNRVQEEAFRSVIADMMVWEAVAKLVSTDIAYDSASQERVINAFTQSMSGRTVWLPREAVEKPAAPTEEQVREFWEAHKDDYKSKERRIISVYTLSPAADSNMESLLYTTDALMQELSQANGRGLDQLLDSVSQNSEFDPFIYKEQDGATHHTYELATEEELGKTLTDTVTYDGAETSLAKVAFGEIANAPAPSDYEAAKAAGDPERAMSIRQIRGFYTTTDGKLKLIRIEAVEPPSVLPYEEARESAQADLVAQREDEALAQAAQKLYEDMKGAIAEKGLQGAFEIAANAGAQVEDYGPVRIEQMDTPLPTGMSIRELLGTPGGQLTPPTVLPTGARISTVTQRTVEDSPALNMQRRLFVLPMENARLRNEMMREWQIAARARFQVQLSPQVRRLGASD